MQGVSMPPAPAAPAHLPRLGRRHSAASCSSRLRHGNGRCPVAAPGGAGGCRRLRRGGGEGAADEGSARGAAASAPHRSPRCSHSWPAAQLPPCSPGCVGGLGEGRGQAAGRPSRQQHQPRCEVCLSEPRAPAEAPMAAPARPAPAARAYWQLNDALLVRDLTTRPRRLGTAHRGRSWSPSLRARISPAFCSPLRAWRGSIQALGSSCSAPRTAQRPHPHSTGRAAAAVAAAAAAAAPSWHSLPTTAAARPSPPAHDERAQGGAGGAGGQGSRGHARGRGHAQAAHTLHAGQPPRLVCAAAPVTPPCSPHRCLCGTRLLQGGLRQPAGALGHGQGLHLRAGRCVCLPDVGDLWVLRLWVAF